MLGYRSRSTTRLSMSCAITTLNATFWVSGSLVNNFSPIDICSRALSLATELKTRNLSAVVHYSRRLSSFSGGNTFEGCIFKIYEKIRAKANIIYILQSAWWIFEILMKHLFIIKPVYHPPSLTFGARGTDWDAETYKLFISKTLFKQR